MCDFQSANYWNFIEKYYPNYYSCDKVLLSDILFRKLNGEKICDSDEEYSKEWDLKKELLLLDKQIFDVALENYIEIISNNKEK